MLLVAVVQVLLPVPLQALVQLQLLQSRGGMRAPHLHPRVPQPAALRSGLHRPRALILSQPVAALLPQRCHQPVSASSALSRRRRLLPLKVQRWAMAVSPLLQPLRRLDSQEVSACTAYHGVRLKEAAALLVLLAAAVTMAQWALMAMTTTMMTSQLTARHTGTATGTLTGIIMTLPIIMMMTTTTTMMVLTLMMTMMMKTR